MMGSTSEFSETRKSDILFVKATNNRFVLVMKNYTWKCTICDRKLATLRDLRKHYPSSHDSKPQYACMECPKTYLIFRSFRIHALLHRDKDKYQCSICQRKFSQNLILQTHLKIHSSERNYICPMCGKSFKSSAQLGRHRKTHSPDKFRYSCEICGKKLVEKYALLQHQKIHQGIKDHICEHCGKSFSQQINLKEHIQAIHTDNFSYPCTKCPKR